MYTSDKGIVNLYSQSINSKFKGSNYYLIALKNEHKNSVLGIFSQWVNFHDEEMKKEVRKLSLIMPDDVKEDLISLNKSPLTVNTKEELTSFMNLGGFAIVDKPLIDIHLSEISAPVVCSSSDDKGFIEYDTLPHKNKARFARDNFRADIINRDNFQCRVCGSSPDDSIHVRLEVHHIKPWEEGGLTIKENLITLCSACHLGVKSFDRWKLYNKIGIKSYYQNSTFFAPALGYTGEQYKTAKFLASNMVEIFIKSPIMI